MNIRRHIKSDISEHLSEKEITLLTGARQVGKSTLLEEIQHELIQEGHKVLYLKLDSEADLAYLKTQELLLKKASIELGDRGFIFIDEIQRKQNAGVFIKGLYDMHLPYKFVITGSGSLELKEKIQESLAGRKQIFEMMPVSFEEFVDYKTNYKYEGRLRDYFEIESNQMHLYLREYLNFGGYPKVITEKTARKKRMIIDEIFNSYVERDLVYWLKINRPDAYNLLIRLLAHRAGMLMNYNDLSAQTGIATNTLKTYLYYAEHTYCQHRVMPYYSNKGKELSKTPVYYFNDIGLRNYSLGVMGSLELPDQLGILFQHLVYYYLKQYVLWQGWDIKYWRTTDKAEVDFIVDKKSSVLPVEVKYGNIKKSKVSRSYRSFIEKYSPTEAWVITTEYTGELTINDTTIKFIPFYEIPNLKID